MAVVTTVETEPTGTYAAGLPQLLPSAGVGGYTKRWAAVALTASPVASWTPIRGDTALAAEEFAPLLAATPEKYVSFTGTESVIARPAQGKTVAMILRPGSGAQSLATMGYWGLTTDAGGTATFVTASRPMSAGEWHVVVMGLDGPNGALNVDGSDVTFAATESASELAVGRYNTTHGVVDVVDIIAWPTLLTDVERNTVAAALRSGHPALFDA